MITELIPGVKVYSNGEYSVLFGCPPEIIKSLMIRNIPLPEYITIPDTVERFGVLQNATEFPLYLFLFVQGNFQKGRKLTILGERDELHRNRELLKLTLLGPTMDEYAALGDNPVYQDLYRESRLLAMKDADGREIPIDGFVNFISFAADGTLETPHFRLRRKALNVYELNGEIIDINFSTPQLPAYDLRPDFVPIIPARFGVDVLGGASGFSARQPCSGLVLSFNADYMLIDCMPYLEYALNARGIARNQIKSIFLTHVHDDHCNMFPLVLANNKMQFLGTKEIFWMACRKLSLMTGHEISEFQSYFDFVELVPDRENEFLGITIQPHYTVHSIPTIGATFSMPCEGHVRRIVFVGDNKSLGEIERMAGQGQVRESKYRRLLQLYRESYDILIADGGMGILHGDPRDSLESQSHRVIFVHLEKLPEEFDTTFSLAQHGKRFTLQESNDSAFIIKTMQILHRHYPGISESWETTLLSNVHLIKYNAGDVIMKQNERSSGMMYVILSGVVSVRHHDGVRLRELTVKEAGDLIGEMAVVTRVEKRSASIVAKTPVTLGEIPEELFYRFLLSENRIETIKQMWSVRKELEINFPFSTLSNLVNMRLAAEGNRLRVKDGESVVHQGTQTREFYIILKGEFEVVRDGEKVNSLTAGAMFGEWGSLSSNLRNATIQAKGEGVVLQIAQESIREIISSSPALNYHVNQLMRERDERGEKTQAAGSVDHAEVARESEHIRQTLSRPDVRGGW